MFDCKKELIFCGLIGSQYIIAVVDKKICLTIIFAPCIIKKIQSLIVMSLPLVSDGAALWYVLQVRSSSELSTVENIKRAAKRRNADSLFEDFNVPSIQITPHGTGKPKKKILCSGYIFMKAHVNELSLSIINEVALGTAGGRSSISFLPKLSTPKPLSEKEYNDMISTIMKSSNDKQNSRPAFEMGMIIKIVSGDFKEFKGTIVGINKEKSTLEVSVSVFSREVTVDAGFDDVEIIK